MKNEQEKSTNNNRIYFIIVALLLCAVAYCSVRGCGSGVGTAEVHQRTDATMERIEKEHTVVGSELDNVTGRLISAGTAVDRADQLITASQERVNQNAASLADCQRLVSDCRKIVADCNRIYAEAEKANRSGTESGG